MKGVAKSNNKKTYFEFILDPTLLEKYLKEASDENAPYDLIKSFLVLEGKSEADLERLDKYLGAKKTLALKVLAMKIMAHLKWNLNKLESKIHSQVLNAIFSDLIEMTGQDCCVDAHLSLDYSLLDHQSIFAILMYHRWALKAFIYNSIAWKHQRLPPSSAQGGPDANLIVMKKREELRLALESQVAISVEVIKNILTAVDKLIVPTMQSFSTPDDDNIDVTPKWDSGVSVSVEEYSCQVLFELTQFLMFRREHEDAKVYLSKCLIFLDTLERNPNLYSLVDFYCVDKSELYGLAMACDVPVCPQPAPDNLLERFKASIANNYTGIIQILQSDNQRQEIPIADRDQLEVEVQVAMSGGTFTVAKDLLMKMQILNILRRVMARHHAAVDVATIMRNGGDRAIQFLISSIQSVLSDAPSKDHKPLSDFLIDLMLCDLTSYDSGSPVLTTSLLADELVRGLFSDEDIVLLENRSVHCEGGKSLTPINPVEDISPTLIQRSPRLETMNIQQQLTHTYDTNAIKHLLMKLSAKDANQLWLGRNSRWNLPIPLQSVITSLPKGMKQDYIYILMAKSRELSNNKDFRMAILLLETIRKESKEAQGIAPGVLYKLNRLVEWEILLVQINQYLEEYPENSIDPEQLTASCKSCLATSSSGDMVIPRGEILESCGLALLNLGEWDILASIDKRWIYLELASAFACACQDITKHKGTKKISRDAWDLILPVFGPSPLKRNNTGATISPTSSNLTVDSLARFLTQLREPTVLSAATSLLARLHNVMRDEPNLEINCIHVGLWPAVLSNSNSYNSRLAAELLELVATRALAFRPNYFPLLKILGDLYYALKDYNSALRYYLEAGAIASDMFTQPVPKSAFDDFIYKRMVKCCSQLQCYTQAALLCQCMDDIDYALAFKNLADTKSVNCADAMDSYYTCIWDITLLEYITGMHQKRGETQRMNLALSLTGLLELNSNNNEEIQREAANVRKNKFLRALTRQYCVNYGGPISRKEVLAAKHIL